MFQAAKCCLLKCWPGQQELSMISFKDSNILPTEKEKEKKKKSCFVNRSQKALEPHIPDTISVMLSSAEPEPTEI